MKKIIAVSTRPNEYTVLRVTAIQLEEIKEYCSRNIDCWWHKANKTELKNIKTELEAGRSWVPCEFIFGACEVVR